MKTNDGHVICFLESRSYGAPDCIGTHGCGGYSSRTSGEDVHQKRGAALANRALLGQRNRHQAQPMPFSYFSNLPMVAEIFG